MKEFADAAEEAIGAQMKGAIPVISIQTLVIKQYSIGFVVKALGFVQRSPRKQTTISTQNCTVSILRILACVYLCVK